MVDLFGQLATPLEDEFGVVRKRRVGRAHGLIGALRMDSAEVEGRVRLCPYYFVDPKAKKPDAKLGGVLATIVPADKKVIHGMSDGALVPCVVETE